MFQQALQVKKQQTEHQETNIWERENNSSKQAYIIPHISTDILSIAYENKYKTKRNPPNNNRKPASTP